MLVTEFGIVTLCRDSHDLKAQSQITFVPSLTTYSLYSFLRNGNNENNKEEAFNSFSHRDYT